MLSTSTLASVRSAGLAKLSCTPAQHTGMLVALSSVGGAVVLGGTAQEESCKGELLSC